jgi:histidinol-phosphate phosphatase family protein
MSWKVEYEAYRHELLQITSQRNTIFASFVTAYVLLLTVIAAFRVSVQWFPLILLGVIMPALLVNHFLSIHYRRIDAYLKVLEHRNPSDLRFYRAYEIQGEISKVEERRLTPSLARRAISHIFAAKSAYTIPILEGYGSLIVVGLLVSLVLAQGYGWLLAPGFLAALTAFVAVPVMYILGSAHYAGRWNPSRLERELTWFRSTNVLDKSTADGPDKLTPIVLVFLDRDGVICRNRKDGVLRLGDFEWVPDVLLAFVGLARPNFRIAVVTNQPYVSEGKLKKEDLNAMTCKIGELARYAGISEKNFALYYCPHKVDGKDLDCQKPKTGLLHRAIKHFELEGSRTARFYIIGDQTTDMECGGSLSNELGKDVKKIRLNWEYGDKTQRLNHKDIENLKGITVVSSLFEATASVLQAEGIRLIPRHQEELGRRRNGL